MYASIFLFYINCKFEYMLSMHANILLHAYSSKNI